MSTDAPGFGARALARGRRFAVAVRELLAAVLLVAIDLHAELLTSAALLAGWACLTIGVHSVTQTLMHGAVARAVWPWSIGLLLLSACGWKFIGRLAMTGLYVATRRRER